MSVGTWILSVYGPAAGAAAAADILRGATPGQVGRAGRVSGWLAAAGRVAGWLTAVGRVAGWLAAATAPGVASYTGVLLSDTAVPAWHDARQAIPGLFVSSAAGAAGGMALLAGAVAGAEPNPAAVRLAVGGAVAEGVAAQVVERRLDPAVRTAWQSGRARTLSRAAAGLGAAGAACVAGAACGAGSSRRGRRVQGTGWRRWVTGAGGAMIAAASGVERFAVMAAGRASAADPRATVGPQRTRLANGTTAPA